MILFNLPALFVLLFANDDENRHPPLGLNLIHHSVSTELRSISSSKWSLVLKLPYWAKMYVQNVSVSFVSNLVLLACFEYYHCLDDLPQP